jgi:hypothetical protein
MVKLIRVTISAIALAGSCFLVAMWARSYSMADVLVHGPVGNDDFIELVSNRGRVIVLQLHNQFASTPRSWERKSVSVNEGRPFPFGQVRKYESFLGFGWIRGPIRSQASYQVNLNSVVAVVRHSYVFYDVPPCTGVIVPYWFLVLFSGVIAVVPHLHWQPQFSMRTLLIVMTLAAMLLGLVAALVHPR